MEIKKIKVYSLAFILLSSALLADTTVYEDGEDKKTTGWYIYDKWPSGASVSNVYNSEIDSQVIKLTGTKTKNGIRLTGWDDKSNHIVEWKMKTKNWVAFYIAIETKEGFRYLYYTPRDYDKGRNLNKQAYKIRMGLGKSMMDGQWHTFSRDVRADLKKYEPNNDLVSIYGIKVRGSCLIDDVKAKGRTKIVLNDLKAFPTAEGAGAETTGGRDGKVVYVTNRKAEGEGSLRWALSRQFKRTIVFAIGGRFNIDRGITLGDKESQRDANANLYSNFTLAGQTANDKGGVHLAHSEERDSDANIPGVGASHFNVYNQENMIFRYFDSRYNWNWFKKLGKNGKEPTLRFTHVNNLIIDHVTSGWSSYGLTILSNAHRANEKTLGNITVQRSLMHENIVNPNPENIIEGGKYQENHNIGMLLGKDPLGWRGATLTKAEWDDMGEFSIHKNAFIGVSHRFPNTSGGENGKFRIVNNYIYGFKGDDTGERVGRFAGTAKNDLIANVYQLRPYKNRNNDSMDFTTKNLYAYLTRETPDASTSKANFYTQNNLFLNTDASKHLMTEDIKSNPYLMLFNYTSSKANNASRKHLTEENAILRANPMASTIYPVSILSADSVKDNLLSNVGGNVRFNQNGTTYIDDEIDQKYIGWAKNNEGPTAFTETLGDGGIGDSASFKYPENINYNADTTEDINASILDSDLDGMPDTWESKHNLNPIVKNNNAVHTDWVIGDYEVKNLAKYTDLEIYLADIGGDFHMLANEK